MIGEHVKNKLLAADWVLVNSSAGKDSQASLDYVVAECDTLGIPRERIVVVHADLGAMEWEGTRELAEEQAARYGLRFVAVSRRTAAGVAQTLLEQVRERGKWPASKQRYCTSDHKRAPIRRAMTMLAKETRAAKGKHHVCVIVNVMGLRAEESAGRAAKPAWEYAEDASNGVRSVYNWLPIHGWTEAQVWERVKASGVRHHRAYDLGMPRLSCCFCIFASREALIIAGHHNRGLLKQYADTERAIGHKFRMSLSMVEVETAVNAGECPTAVPAWTM